MSHIASSEEFVVMSLYESVIRVILRGSLLRSVPRLRLPSLSLLRAPEDTSFII